MLTGTSLGIILLVALLGLAASGVPIVGRFPEILAFPAGIAALAALHHFAYRRALRAESSAEGAWLSAGDPTVYPFRGIDDLLAAGGDHSLVEPRGSCPRCGYDLSTLSFPGCPECGLGRSQG